MVVAVSAATAQPVDYEEPNFANITWDHFNTLAEIHGYMNHILGMHENLATLISLGMTYEDRDILGLRITNKTLGDDKPIVFIDGGSHPSEWIATAAATYVFHALIHNHSPLRDFAEFVVVPSLNPDGYEYSWNTDRLWGKNRAVRGEDCVGVDLNHNFDFHWMEVGGSDDPCEDAYAGPKANSELEVQALSNFMAKNADRMLVYISLHSFGQMFMYSYGYDYTYPSDKDELDRVAKLAVDAMRAVNDTQYEYGAACDIRYLDSGSARDYIKGVVEVPYAYTIELRDTGDFGVLLPDDQIFPTVQEAWAGIEQVVTEALESFHKYKN